MKKLFLSAVMLTGVLCTAMAQNDITENKTPQPPTQIENNFSMPVRWINVRDFVHLPNKGLMVIELNNPDQYNELEKLDSLMTAFMKEIAFYKDSLENSAGPVRIDYTLDEEFSFHKLRFKKYAADGDIFMTRPGDVAKLKLEQDTVRFYIRHNPVLERKSNSVKDYLNNYNYNHTHARFYQVTFYLNSYTDIATVAADKQAMQHAFDTLKATKKKITLRNPDTNPSSTRYNPYTTTPNDLKRNQMPFFDTRFKQYKGLVKADHGSNQDVLTRTDLLTSTGNLGMGLVRNTFAPYAEVGLSLILNGRRLYDNEYNKLEVGLSVSTYALFEKTVTGDYDMHANNFVNLNFGKGKDMSIGVGYLFSQSGNYFKGTTTKLFFNVTLLKKGLTLSPELICTNDFNQIFPGLTLKVF